MIVYEPSLGFKWSPYVCDLPAVKNLYTQWGDSAIHYICWFSHPCSPYITVTTDEERDISVIGELKAHKWGKTRGQTMVYPSAMYMAKEYAEAAEAILKLRSIPDFMEVIMVDRQIEAAIADERRLKSSTDAETAAKIIKAKKDNQVLLKSLYAQRHEAAERFRKACSHAGLITPDEIWQTL